MEAQGFLPDMQPLTRVQQNSPVAPQQQGGTQATMQATVSQAASQVPQTQVTCLCPVYPIALDDYYKCHY